MKATPSKDAHLAGILLITAATVLIVAGFSVAARDQTDAGVLSILSFVDGKAPVSVAAAAVKRLAWDAIFRGIMLGAIGALVIFRWDLLRTLAERERLWIGISSVVLVVVWGPMAMIGPTAEFDGERYWWLMDDAMISMRYAHNLASGLGLVWNPGERVEGYTNFLWTMYMTLIHLLPVPLSKTSLVVLATNLGIAVATIPVLVRLLRVLGGGTIATVATVGGYVMNKNICFGPQKEWRLHF